MYKLIIIILMLVSSEAMAGINYCAVNREFTKNCDEFRKSIPFLGRAVNGSEFTICCYNKETYEEFLKAKSK